MMWRSVKFRDNFAFPTVYKHVYLRVHVVLKYRKTVITHTRHTKLWGTCPSVRPQLD